MTILETFIRLRDDLKAWVTNNLNQKANISYVDEKFNSITEFDPTEIQKAIDANTAAINTKVDKVEGKGLSTNDYTTTEKDKLSTVEANANFYEHPVHDSHSLGLYKVTVDASGHVSGATLAGKEDIVALGIPAQDTTYEEEIEGLSDRLDDVENDISVIINETLNDLSGEFENYKETNNKAVATNASGIEANKASIEEIQGDYLTSTDKTQLQDDISKVSEKATANAAAIEVLNGEGDGSVKQSIDNAFNEFAAKVTNDDVVNTYKELIDYAAEHGPQFTELVGKVDDVDKAINNHVIDKNNPHNVTKSQVGLDQVDNTSDLDKPISNAVNEALQGKADSGHTHAIGQIDSLQDLLDELQTGIDTIEGEVETKADVEHNHEELYYDKDEILGLITVAQIEDICQSTQSSGGNLDLVNVATQYWVEQFYQKKGNYLTAQDMNNHDISASSHSDIRSEIEDLSDAFNKFIECDDDTIKQIRDVIKFVKDNDSIITGITNSKVSISDIIDNLNTNVSNKPLSAAQGVVLKSLIDALQAEVEGKTVVTDKHLSTSDAPADAKAVGDAIKNLNETKVSTTRKINGKPLSEDINLTAADIGVTTDKNLATEGVPADAKAVGDALSGYATVEALETLVGDTSVASQIADAIDDISNVVKYDVAQDLTDEQKAQARANIGVDDFDIEIDEISVQLGENGAIGGYKTGDVIAAGTDIRVILNKLFQKAIAATYKEPTLSLSNNGGTASGNIEAGSSITPKLIASFTNNDSGGLTSIKIMQGGTIVANGTAAALDYNGEDIVIGDETITFTASADYSAAPVKNNNLGEESIEDWFDGGTVTSSYSITGRRQLFCGTGAGALPTITSDVVRGLSGKKLAPAHGNSFKINVAAGQQYIIIAYPIGLRDVSDITYVEINDNMTSNFTKSIVQVADARGGENGLVDYKVYTYEMKVQAEANMTFKVTI